MCRSLYNIQLMLPRVSTKVKPCEKMKSTDYKIKQLNHTNTVNPGSDAGVDCIRVITNYSYPRRCQAGTHRRLRIETYIYSMFWLYFVLSQNIYLLYIATHSGLSNNLIFVTLKTCKFIHKTIYLRKTNLSHHENASLLFQTQPPLPLRTDVCRRGKGRLACFMTIQIQCF